jgi:hypothetical protein
MNEKVKRIVRVSALGAFISLGSVSAWAADPPAPGPAPDSAPTATPTATPTPPADVPPVASEPANVVRAREKKAEGDKAMDSLRYADALVAYNESYSLDPKPALLYNLGRTLEALDQLPEAAERLEAFQKSAPPDLLAKVPNLKERIASIKKRISQLTIKVNVAGARVLVRDAVVGSSPLDKPLVMKAGKANVLVEAEGYFPYQTTIDLPGGGAYIVDAQMSSRQKFGRIIVQAPKENVTVAIDGKTLGLAPVETLVTPGTHQIMAQHAEHSDFATSVIVDKPGTERTVMVELGSPPLYKRPLFWTAIGATVVGATIITIVALTERAPGRGDIPPGQLTPNFFVSSPVFKF